MYKRSSWKTYQARLNRTKRIKRRALSILKYAGYFSVFLFVIYLSIVWSGAWFGGIACHYRQRNKAVLNDKTSLSENNDHTLAKKDVQTLLDRKSFINIKDESFSFDLNGKNCYIDTSIDISLQNFILKKMNVSTSRYIGIVVMDPSTGRVLSMTGFDKKDSKGNPCINDRFPAASIFKIITAAAAIEKCGFNSNSRFSYNGKKHTLYKSQLKERKNRYTNYVTLKKSFAQSINPVFGKIGALYLGKSALEKYAAAFGFNQHIDFEIPFLPSRFSISDQPYQWAEIASGFNKDTVISPLHGALMASVIINQGRLIEPTIIDKIIDDKGKILYQSRMTLVDKAIKPNTSRILTNMMTATIKSGTGRKVFRGYRKDRVLSRLNIGGKTGSIDNRTHDVRYDWFVGFAKERNGPKEIVASIVVAHEKYIGTKACQYARIIFKRYFKDYFAKNSVTMTHDKG